MQFSEHIKSEMFIIAAIYGIILHLCSMNEARSEFCNFSKRSILSMEVFKKEMLVIKFY